MKLRVSHHISYSYPSPVRDSFNEIRLQPAQNTTQTRHTFSIRTDPRKAFAQYLDFYGNIVHYFEVSEPHQQLSIDAISEIETLPDPRPTPPKGQTPANLNLRESRESLHDFLLASKYIDLTPEIWRTALDILPNGITDIVSDTAHLANWIHRNFTCESESSRINTTTSECLPLRRGTCLDFAHIMIGLCRSLKLPARFVSGYLYEESKSGSSTGDDAVHAWIEIYVPSYGWHAIDPTHNRPVDQHYIKVATGRDYADIRPIAGTYRGPSSREISISVRISEV